MSTPLDVYLEPIEGRFPQILDTHLPRPRSTGLSDRIVFCMIMDVLMHGKTHRDAAGDRWSQEAMLQRQREYAASPILSQFLIGYGALHIYYAHGGERPAFLSRRDYPFGSGRGGSTTEGDVGTYWRVLSHKPWIASGGVPTYWARMCEGGLS